MFQLSILSQSLHTCAQRLLLGLLLGLLLTGCAAVGGRELATFDLTAPQDLQEITGRSNAQILVPVPTALKSLNSERIVVRPNLQEITYFGDAQWSDRLPNMVQDKLIQTFENSGRIRSVAKPGDGVVVDYKIAANIRNFELLEDGSGKALVTLSVKIINDRTGRVRASRLFSANVPATLSSSAKSVEALDMACDQILKETLDWVLKVI